MAVFWYITVGCTSTASATRNNAQGPTWAVEDSDIRCERLAVGNVFGVAVPGFSISTSHISTDSSRVCANPLVPW